MSSGQSASAYALVPIFQIPPVHIGGNPWPGGAAAYTPPSLESLSSRTSSSGGAVAKAWKDGHSWLKQQSQSKDEEIASLKERVATLEANLKRCKPVDLVDLTNERENKRPRTESYTASTSNLAIRNEQNHKMVQLKQEKNEAVTTLQNVREELEDARDDLGIANDTVQHQALATDVWQRRFDELALLAEAGRVDGATISEIRTRSLASGL